MSAVIKLSSPATHEFWEIPVLFEDEHLLALDKPAGLLLSPDAETPERPSLMSLLHAGIADGKPWAKERGVTFLGNPYRLDTEIGGVLLLAKSKPVLVSLADLFGSERPGLTYIVLARGEPAEEQFTIDSKLSSHDLKPGLMRIDPRGGKKSRTHVEVLERFSRYVLLKCEALTNRPHQIRVHLRHAGLPVVGDMAYGGRPLYLSTLKRDYRLKEGKIERPLTPQAAIHCEQLSIPHPLTGEPLTITSQWPKDLKVAVKYLRQFGK